MKRNTLVIVLALSMVLLAGCSQQKSTASTTSANTDTSKATQSSSQSSNAAQLAQWPDEFNGKLPTPVCKITDVTRYDEKSMSGKLTIVSFSDMSLADARAYVEALKSMGFSGGMTIDDGTKIVFSGVGTDSSAQNGVNFMYQNSDQTGTISY